MERASWFLAQLSGQLPDDVDNNDYPELDEIDFVIDSPDDLWSKNQIKQAYQKPDGTYDKNKFDSDYQKSTQKYANRVMFKTQAGMLGKIAKKIETPTNKNLFLCLRCVFVFITRFCCCCCFFLPFILKELNKKKKKNFSLNCST